LGYRNQMLGYVAADPAYPLDYGYDSTDFYEAWHVAAGGHVKKGIFPFINQRVGHTQNQFISGDADPVLWRPRLLGASNQGPIHATVVVCDESVPTSVLLQHRESGSTVWTAVDLYDDGLHGDGAAGDRTYGNSFTVSGSVTQLDYRFAAQDVQAQLGQWPCTYATHSLHPFPAVVLNEAQSANQTTVYDQNGDDSDWLELYNLGSSSASLDGFYLSDDPGNPAAFRFKSGSIQGNGHTLVWASDDTSQYPNHAPFKLSSRGDWLGLFYKDSSGVFHLMDEVQLPALDPDQSFGRYTDGHPQWVVFDQHPTPYVSNAGNLSDTEQSIETYFAYPNPHQYGVWIAGGTGEEVHLNIKNILGQTIQSYEGQLPYYWQNTVPGLFIVEIEVDQTITTLKILKEMH
jgi:hypothetical protein